MSSYLELADCRSIVPRLAADPAPVVREAVARIIPRLFPEKKRQANKMPFLFMEPSPDWPIRIALDQLGKDENDQVKTEAILAIELIHQSDQARSLFDSAKLQKQKRNNPQST